MRNTNKRRTARGLGLIAALAAAGWAGNALPVAAEAEPSRNVASADEQSGSVLDEIVERGNCASA